MDTDRSSRPAFTSKSMLLPAPCNLHSDSLYGDIWHQERGSKELKYIVPQVGSCATKLHAHVPNMWETVHLLFIINQTPCTPTARRITSSVEWRRAPQFPSDQESFYFLKHMLEHCDTVDDEQLTWSIYHDRKYPCVNLVNTVLNFLLHWRLCSIVSIPFSHPHISTLSIAVYQWMIQCSIADELCRIEI